MDLGPDELEGRLRAALADDRLALPVDAVPLTAVHRGAVRRRRRRHAVAGAAAAAVLASIAVPVASALAPRESPGRFSASVGTPGPTLDRRTAPGPTGTPNTAAPAAASPRSSPAPLSGLAWDGARVVSVTALSTRTLVVLGQLGESFTCTPPDCVRLAASADGGATYRPLAVPADARNAGRNAATDVRFGSPADGWLFGPALWSTHDGGRSWTRRDLGGQVRGLAAARGRVWALVAAPGDTEALWTSAVTDDDWRPVPGVTVQAPGDVATLGDRVVVVGIGDSPAWVGEAGRFTAHPGPCGSAIEARLSAAAEVWARCTTGTLAYLARSVDGATWRPLRGPRDLPNNLAVGARRADALLAGGDTPMTRVRPDGATVALRTPPPAAQFVTYIGFTTDRVGLAVAGNELFRTTDGGDTWAPAGPR